MNNFNVRAYTNSPACKKAKSFPPTSMAIISLVAFVVWCFIFETNVSSSSHIQSCKTTVAKSEITYFTVYYQKSKCCDNWCTSTCYVMVSETQNQTVYFLDTVCCSGYDGDLCLPVCSEGCGPNKECSMPDQCTCIAGWIGNDCQQVDGLTYSNLTSNSSQLSWLSPGNDNVIGYVILWSTGSQTMNMSISSGLNTTSITGLQPFTKYRSCVVPLLISGNGTASCVDFRTSESAPDTPLNVHVMIAGESSLLIQWEPPMIPNGIIIHYILYINYTNGSEISTRTVDGQFTLYLLEGLTPYQQVGISVSATTGGGEGPQSHYIYNTTKQTDMPTFTPPLGDNLLSVVRSTPLSVLIWQPPTNIGVSISYYLIQLYDKAIKKQQWTLHTMQILNVTVELEPYVPYQVTAIAVSSTGAAGLVSNNTFFLKEGAPLVAPDVEQPTRQTPSIGLVNWTTLTLSESRGFITNYIVTYSESTSSLSCYDTMNAHTITVTDTWVQLTELDIQKPYCVSVSALTVAGQGPQSIKELIPIYENTWFCIQLKDVYNCSLWKLTGLQSKLNDISKTLVEVFNVNCTCQLTSNHISKRQLSCLSSQPDRAVFNAQLIGIETFGTTKLLTVLEKWRNENQVINVDGLRLQVVTNCNNPSRNDCVCSSPPTMTTDADPNIKVDSDFYLATLVLGIMLAVIAAFLVFTCLLLILYCYRYYNKFERCTHYPKLCVYQNSIDSSETSVKSTPNNIEQPCKQ